MKMAQTKSQVDKTLNANDKRYGNFAEQAATAQCLKSQMRAVNKMNLLQYDQREALELIATKISRILHGDPTYIDSWHDISGYATLIERRLIEEQDDGK